MKIHKPVLLEETIELLELKSGQIVVDMTAGYGGHSSKVLKAIGPKGRLILIDQDQQAINELKAKFADHDNVSYIHSNFAKLDWEKIGKIDRALMDLGVSSPQLDEADRGFSFSKEARLDMRMDQSSELTAYYIVNEYSEEELADIIYQFGEEKKARRIAKAIVEQRGLKRIETTTQLAEIIEKTIGSHGRINPATKTFQAIRIATNAELSSLEKVLPQVTDNLNKDGRLAVISFHSLEDRIVKNYFKKLSTSPKDPVTGMDVKSPNFRLTNRKPIKGSVFDNNPRARSAKLRAVEKIK